MTEPPEGVSAIEWSYQQNRKIDINLEPRQPVFMQLADSLRANILSGQVSPGDRLPGLEQLAKQASVSRMTVQQALRVLKDEGLVRSHQGKGIYVAPPGSGDVSVVKALAQDLAAPKGLAVYAHGLGPSVLSDLFARVAPDRVASGLRVSILLVRPDAPRKQELVGLAMAATETEVRWLSETSARSGGTSLPAFLRLTSGQVFMPLGEEGTLGEPEKVLHFIVNPSETDSLATAFQARWENAYAVKVPAGPRRRI